MNGGKGGFTLIEMMVVIAIISIIAAIGLSVTKSDQRFSDVQAAARELAAYLRSARSSAMRTNAQLAVNFNIANGKGTTGAVLNNWDGGHWYRLLGATEFDFSRGNYGLSAHPWPGRFSYFEGGSQDNQNNIPILQRRVRSSWLGEAQRLQARHVRFLALTDLDLGQSHRHNFSMSENNGFKPDTFSATYPRAWCGWWDATSKRLYPWGGYDPALTSTGSSGNTQHHSAFYYQGNSASTISGCVNPSGRTSDALYTEFMNQNSAGKEIFVAGASRPLVNADWMDWYLSFRPDGSVQAGKFGEARYQSYMDGGVAMYGTSAGPGLGDIGDMCPNFSRLPKQRTGDTISKGNSTVETYQLSHDIFPATSFQERSGYWYITLCPDIVIDTDRFASVGEALRSLTPMFRVGINAQGDVRVVQVHTFLPSGRVLDDVLTDNAWQDKAQTNLYFQYNLRTSDINGTPSGEPIVDTLVPEMLLKRVFWYK
jgi:prepilin-type N-terminal cleavage/methylation domain-containing protein